VALTLGVVHASVHKLLDRLKVSSQLGISPDILRSLLPSLDDRIQAFASEPLNKRFQVLSGLLNPVLVDTSVRLVLDLLDGFLSLGHVLFGDVDEGVHGFLVFGSGLGVGDHVLHSVDEGVLGLVGGGELFVQVLPTMKQHAMCQP